MTVDHRVRVISGSPDDAQPVIDTLDKATIRVIVTGAQPTTAHQLIAVTLVDLLARLFPRLHVVVTDAAVTTTPIPARRTALAAYLRDIRQYGGLTPLDATPPAFTIAIGVTNVPADLYVDADAWQSYLGTHPSQLRQSGSAVPFGPLVAACRAAAHAFDTVLASFRPPREIPRSRYSTLLGFETSSSPIADRVVAPTTNVHLLLVGAGSIGGASVYAFAQMPGFAGTLAIADPESLEVRNPVKAILAHHDEALAGAAKVDVARQALAHHRGLDVTTFRGSVAGYHATLDRTAVFPTVLCAVDSIEARRELQDCLPLEVVNAACSTQDIAVSRHITDSGPCVCCLHMGDVLNGALKRTGIIARDTGLQEIVAIQMLNSHAPLTADNLRHIERHRSMPEHALDQYLDRTLDELWREELLYAEAPVQLASSQTQATVATAFITALAGFILAAEAVKPNDIDARLRLGPDGLDIRYVENGYASPEYRQLDSPARWATVACLCNSPRRLRVLRDRYDLVATDGPAARL